MRRKGQCVKRSNGGNSGGNQASNTSYQYGYNGNGYVPNNIPSSPYIPPTPRIGPIYTPRGPYSENEDFEDSQDFDHSEEDFKMEPSEEKFYGKGHHNGRHGGFPGGKMKIKTVGRIHTPHTMDGGEEIRGGRHGGSRGGFGGPAYCSDIQGGADACRAAGCPISYCIGKRGGKRGGRKGGKKGSGKNSCDPDGVGVKYGSAVICSTIKDETACEYQNCAWHGRNKCCPVKEEDFEDSQDFDLDASPDYEDEPDYDYDYDEEDEE